MDEALILLSGGVDSTVALFKLLDAGYKITGLVLKLSSSVPDSAHLKNIENISKDTGIEVIVKDIEHYFKKTIIDHFVSVYAAGKTPNPCARCNRWIKFNFGIEIANELGIYHIATGHYADKTEFNGKKLLKIAKDRIKSQEYFLARLTEEQIERAIFPLSHMTKKEVDDYYNSRLYLHKLPESQDICFLREQTHLELISSYGVEGRGNLVDENGIVIGKHNGYFKYTLGQRRGTGYAAGERVYVKHIDPLTHDVALGSKESLQCSEFDIEEPIFYITPVPNYGIDVKVRYSKKTVPGILEFNNNQWLVKLDMPSYNVVPGQLAVFYKDNTVIGSGWIK